MTARTIIWILMLINVALMAPPSAHFETNPVIIEYERQPGFAIV